MEGDDAAASSSALNDRRVSSEDSASDNEDSAQSEWEDVSDDNEEEEDSEFSSAIASLREITRVQEILSRDSVPSASRMICDAEEIGSELHSLSFESSQPTAQPNLPIVNAVRDISTRLVSFSASVTGATGEAQPSSVFHAARQIAYWSSVFVSMMATPAPVTSSANPASATCSTTTTTTTTSTNSTPIASYMSQNAADASFTLPSSNLPAVQPAPQPSSVQPAPHSPSLDARAPTVHLAPQPLSVQRAPHPPSVQPAPCPPSVQPAPCPPPVDAHPPSVQPAPRPPSVQPAPWPSPVDVHPPTVQPAPQPLYVQSAPHPPSVQPAHCPPSVDARPPTVLPAPQPLYIRPAPCPPSVQPHPAQPSHTSSVHYPFSIQPFPHPSPMQPCNENRYSVNPPPNSSSSGQPSQPSYMYVQPNAGSSHSQHSPGPSSLQPPLCTLLVIRPTRSITDPPTLVMFQRYGLAHPSPLEWLNSLKIPRKVESLNQVKDIWEVGGPSCPPLKDWTVVMRNHRSLKGANTSIYSQRKFVYKLFQRHNFNVDSVLAEYNEVKPGKLYKILNSKGSKRS
ncbi:hypothetical protein OS493_018518 [Desmophyllum pertusum]|uniref:Uncharacterized protein n=1 Tax=Desmophyllum pertusum TaxID=174260 RepID=A0A9X0A0Z3_9CNID|nr:hypothetical protein OS493_018518 [Desmophyllum pertusum]